MKKEIIMLVGMALLFFLSGILVAPTIIPIRERVEYIEEIKEIEIETIKEVPPTADYESLGEFELTAYCPCAYCSGSYGNSTATGVVAVEGVTIAVDPTVIPYGSIVVINGHSYIAQDCGAAVKGNIIDIYFESHEEAEAFGRQRAEVYIVKYGGE